MQDAGLQNGHGNCPENMDLHCRPGEIGSHKLAVASIYGTWVTFVLLCQHLHVEAEGTECCSMSGGLQTGNS